MTIKKSQKDPIATEETKTPAATGGATIADRFKLDVPAEPVKPAVGKGATIAALAGLAAAAVAGILTYVLWQHWQFLMSA